MKEEIWNETVELTGKLVAIPSENPLGNEECVAKFIRGWLESNDLPAELIEAGPKRINVVSKINGQGSRPPVILLAHMDTVPAGDGWTFSPFSGEIRGNRLLGRGSTDMKGGLAAAMIAFREVARKGIPPAGDILLTATADEEGADMIGIMNLIHSGVITREMTVICTEPSGLCLCPAHKGVLWYLIVVKGKRVHGGNAHLGADSNRAAARVILALEKRVVGLPFHHDLLGDCTFTVGEISGGEKINVVPDKTIIKVDFRTVPPLTVGEADTIIEEESQNAIKDMKGISIMTKRISLARPPVETALTSPIVTVLKEAYRETMHQEMKIKSFPAYTDGAMAQSQIGLSDSIVFGPGELENAHTVDESVDIEQLKYATKILYHSLSRLLYL